MSLKKTSLGVTGIDAFTDTERKIEPTVDR